MGDGLGIIIDLEVWNIYTPEMFYFPYPNIQSTQSLNDTRFMDLNSEADANKIGDEE